MCIKMSDTASPVVAKAAKAPKVPKIPKVKKPAASHPPTSEMVQSAIKNLKERNGSSVKAIKSYIATTYKLDAEKFAPFIKKYLKSAVVSGDLVQPKGKGANGSFKLSSKTKENKPKSAKPKKEKPLGEKKAKKVQKPKPAKKPIAKKSVKKTAEKKASVKTPVKAKPNPAKPKAKTPKTKKAKSAVKPKSPKVKKTSKK